MATTGSKPEFSQAGRAETKQATAGAGSVSSTARDEQNDDPGASGQALQEKAGPQAARESLVELKETERSPHVAAPAIAAPQRQRPRWMWPAVAAGVLLLGFVAAWGVILRVKTANGMIELVNLPKDAEVLVDGAVVSVTWPGGGKPAVITVTPGKHKVMVKKDGIEISDDEVTVQADGKEKFSVRFVASDQTVARTSEGCRCRFNPDGEKGRPLRRRSCGQDSLISGFDHKLDRDDAQADSGRRIPDGLAGQ